MDDDTPPLCLNPDVSEWLIRQAGDLFAGDVEKALNHYLTEAMRRHLHWQAQGVDPGNPPPDPWARLEANLPTDHDRGRRPPH